MYNRNLIKIMYSTLYIVYMLVLFLLCSVDIHAAGNYQARCTADKRCYYYMYTKHYSYRKSAQLLSWLH